MLLFGLAGFVYTLWKPSERLEEGNLYLGD